MTKQLPKSLWRFYMQYAFPGRWFIIFLWAFFTLALTFDNVLFPFYQKWLVATLETPIPAGMSWLQHILPTIILIVVLDLTIMGCSLLRWVFFQRWGPYVEKRYICCFDGLYTKPKFGLVGVTIAR